MGKIKNLLIDMIAEADLTEAQELAVLDLLESVNNPQGSIEDQITWAIKEVKSKPTGTVEKLHKLLHDTNNKYQVKLGKLEIENLKLRKCLKDILSFEYGSFPAAKALMDSLED